MGRIWIRNDTMNQNLLPNDLFNEISELIQAAKRGVVNYANHTLVMLYWKVGAVINQHLLKEERAEYGANVINELANRLTIDYGSGFSARSLSRMIQFSKTFPDQSVVSTLSQNLSWSHFRELMHIGDPLKRDFYIEMSRLEQWSIRALKEKIDGMLYERTAIAKQPEKLIRLELDKFKDGNRMNPDLYLQDPYLLNFLYPRQLNTERDLEDAILNELQAFIQSMGTQFCFVARQKRMSTQDNDRYLDLLFFHRVMRRLIAIELKMTAFQPEHAGQMEWYLKWLDKYERQDGEEKPLGIIICSRKDREDIELLELDKNGIHVSQYLTELPPREMFEEKLHAAIQIARERYELFHLPKK